jgi:hypothetical protein
MKKNKLLTILLFLIIAITSSYSQNNERYNALSKTYNENDIVFEGLVQKTNPSYYTQKREIYTSYDVKVTKPVKNCKQNQIITVSLRGGTIGDASTEVTHGFVIVPNTVVLFFCKENTDANTKIDFMGVIENPSKIVVQFSPNTDAYTTLTDLYTDLNKIAGVSLKVEKKSIIENETKNQTNQEAKLPAINNDENTKNFNAIVARLKNQISLQAKQNNILANDLTLAVSNVIQTQSLSTKYLEFDVLVKSNVSTTYFDNAIIQFSYNPTAFGTNVVANNKISIVNGTQFNTSTYNVATSNLSDATTSAFQFVIGSSTTTSIYSRVLLNTTYKQLVRIKLQIGTCNQNSNIGFDNTSFTSIFSLYTSTPNAPQSAGIGYANTLYGTGINRTLCTVKINNFNTNIKAGVSETLTISGYNLGKSFSTSSIQFKNADDVGFPYIPLIDPLDTISWTDTLIMLRMPSRVQSYTTTGLTNTPGTGNFKIINSMGEIGFSSTNTLAQTFTVDFALNNRKVFSTASIKSKYNLASIKNTGGLILRVDTSISNHPNRYMCVKKAVKDWRCIAGVNIKITNDTTLQLVKQDSVSTIFMSNNNLGNFVAATSANIWCGTAAIITDFDTEVIRSLPFFYDTTGADLPKAKYDFYEVMLHEIGHGFGLLHTLDTGAVMFYRSLYLLSTSTATGIPGINRRTLINSSTDDAAGTYQVSSSIAALVGNCGFADVVDVLTGSCGSGQIGIKELFKNTLELKAYPNPLTDGELSLTFKSNSNNITIDIYDVLGNRVYSEKVVTQKDNNYTHKLNLDGITNGVYIITIGNSYSYTPYKLIKN